MGKGGGDLFRMRGFVEQERGSGEGGEILAEPKLGNVASEGEVIPTDLRVLPAESDSFNPGQSVL
jgi:hypothetical protein